MAHRDAASFDGPPSLSGHCGHEAIFAAQRSVANDPHLPSSPKICCDAQHTARRVAMW